MVRVADIELHVEERGAGDPPLLLIAGIPAVASDWRPLAERQSVALIEGFQRVALIEGFLGGDRVGLPDRSTIPKLPQDRRRPPRRGTRPAAHIA